MNEMKLKDLFVSSLESGHILNSKGGSVSFASREDEVRIKSEGYFRQFDLVIVSCIGMGIMIPEKRTVMIISSCGLDN